MTDAKLDLVLERVVDVSPELVWKAWTVPEYLMQWFTPKPWKTVACEIDLRPGGHFHTMMQSPEGEDHPNHGCYLEVVPNRRLVWTDALEGGFRPTTHGAHLPFRFTAIVEMFPEGNGTRYVATVMHDDPKHRQAHEEMGFFDGWNAALDQLVELVKKTS